MPKDIKLKQYERTYIAYMVTCEKLENARIPSHLVDHVGKVIPEMRREYQEWIYSIALSCIPSIEQAEQAAIKNKAST